jgi:hypothetical protein
VNVTLPTDSVQPVEVLSSVIATLSFDVALALGVYEPRALPADGAALAEMALLVVPAAEAGDEVMMKPLTTSAEVSAKVNDAAAVERTLWRRTSPFRKLFMRVPAFSTFFGELPSQMDAWSGRPETNFTFTKFTTSSGELTLIVLTE